MFQNWREGDTRTFPREVNCQLIESHEIYRNLFNTLDIAREYINKEIKII